MSNFLNIYNKLSKLPLGKFLFNKGIGLSAPFFGKIHPNVVVLEPGVCVVRMKDRWSVRNHIGTINAGAMCTLVELAGGMAVDAAIPRHLRWIPKKMSVEYLAKGEGPLEARCEFNPDQIQEGDIEIPVYIVNSGNRKVFTANITFYISKRK